MPEIARMERGIAIKACVQWLAAVPAFLKGWFQPHRRAAFVALIKASLLLGTLSELAWLLNTYYFSRRFSQLPISLAWSMLTVIFFITWTQVIWSIALKLRSARCSRLSAAAHLRLTALLAAYISGENVHEEIKLAAEDSPEHFESRVAVALLGLRGSALRRLCELPEVLGLRLKWIEKSRTGDNDERRHAVERMGLLRDPDVIPALENALDDSDAGVVASAVRGLLQMDSYGRRDELVRSLPNRPYLVRVLTACESPDVAPMLESTQTHAHLELLKRAAVEVAARPRPARAIPTIEEFAIEYESADAARAACSALAVLGGHGRELLRLMSALGEAGDAPAEALGESLAAAARGGRT